jgi:hypothetical protein
MRLHWQPCLDLTERVPREFFIANPYALQFFQGQIFKREKGVACIVIRPYQFIEL